MALGKLFALTSRPSVLLPWAASSGRPRSHFKGPSRHEIPVKRMQVGRQLISIMHAKTCSGSFIYRDHGSLQNFLKDMELLSNVHTESATRVLTRAVLVS